MKRVSPFRVSQMSSSSIKSSHSIHFTPERTLSSQKSIQHRGKSSSREKCLQAKIDKILKQQGQKIHNVLTQRAPNKYQKNKITFKSKENTGKKLFFDDCDGENNTEKCSLEYSSKYSENQMKCGNLNDDKSINFSNYQFKVNKSNKNRNSELNSMTIRQYLKLSPSEAGSQQQRFSQKKMQNSEQKHIIQEIRELKSMIKGYFEEGNGQTHRKIKMSKTFKDIFTQP